MKKTRKARNAQKTSKTSKTSKYNGKRKLDLQFTFKDWLLGSRNQKGHLLHCPHARDKIIVNIKGKSYTYRNREIYYCPFCGKRIDND